PRTSHTSATARARSTGRASPGCSRRAMGTLQSRAGATDGLRVAHRVARCLAGWRPPGDSYPERRGAGVPVRWRAFAAVGRTPVDAAAFLEHDAAVSLREVDKARSHRAHQPDRFPAIHRTEEDASIGGLQRDAIDAGQSRLQDTPHHAGVRPPEQIRLDQECRPATTDACAGQGAERSRASGLNRQAIAGNDSEGGGYGGWRKLVEPQGKVGTPLDST